MNAGETTPIIQVRRLVKHFPVRRGMFQRLSDAVRAVDGVDLDIAPHRTIGLVGESGCGKSTVARMILRLLLPDSGSIRFEGREITGISEARFKPLRKQIQMVFQDPYSSLNPRMTVAQSIAEGVRIAGIVGQTAQRRRVEALLDMVGMPAASADRYPHEFSGGQRQRVGIARALSVAPRLILCDEPISALDVSIQAQIINLLNDLKERLALSYLFISHDLNVVSYICDHVYVMFRGRIVESAPTADLFDAPKHPYTRKLLAAAPVIALSTQDHARPALKKTESKLSPEPMHRAESCPFGSQCPDAEDQCLHESPTMRRIGPDHLVCCRRAKEISQ